MNWLIIASTGESSSCSQVKSFFQQYSVRWTLMPARQKLSESSFVKILDALSKITHCVVTDFDEIAAEKSFLIILGYMLGKKIPVIVNSVSGKGESLFVQDHIHTFSNIGDVLNYVQGSLPDYEIEERRIVAFTKLFEQGIPFTPNSFSTYIADNKIDICKLFLQAGMNVNSRDSVGTPMLSIAARNDQPDVVSWLLRNKADIDAVSKDRGYSAVMDAVWKCNYEITEMLVKSGANLNFISRDGQSVLVLAVGTGNIRITQLLAEYGADPDIKDSMGMSAREYAVLFKKPAMVEAFKIYKK